MGGVSDVERDVNHRAWSHLVVRIVLVLIVIVSILLLVASLVSASVLIYGRDFDYRGVSVTNNVTTYITNNITNNITSSYFIDNNFTYYINTVNNITQIYNQSYNDSALLFTISFLNATTLKTFGDQVLFGGLTVNGDLNVIGSIVNLTVVNEFVNGSILPSLPSLFDLGSPDLKWANVWAENLYNKSEVDLLIAGVNVTTYVTNNITVENNNTFFVNMTNNITTYINESYNDSVLLGRIDAVNQSLLNYMFVNGSNSNISSLHFDLNPIVNVSAGDLFWDAPDKTLALKGEDWTLQIGQELYAIVYNDKAFTIGNGKAVYIDGVVGSLPTVAYARADDPSTAFAIGITTQDILSGSTGMVTLNGVVHGIDTSLYVTGQQFYVSPSEEGNFTVVKPTYPNIAISLGYILQIDSSLGDLFVRTRTSEVDPYWGSEKVNYYNMSQVDSLIADIVLNDSITDSIYALNVSLSDEVLARVGNDSYLLGLIGNLSDNDSLFALNSSLANYYLNSNPFGFINQSVSDLLYYNKSYVDVISTRQSNRYAGFKVLPILADNGDGSMNFSSGTVVLYNNSNFVGAPLSYNVIGGITGFAGVNAIPDGSISYLVAEYNAGSPIIQLITNRDLIHQSDVVPLATITRTGNKLYVLDWGDMGNGMAEKLNDRFVRTDRYAIETGVVLGQGVNNNTLTATSGVIWFGATRLVLDPVDTAVSGVDIYYHDVNGSGFVTVFNASGSYYNSVWDNGTGLVELDNATYANVWVYRSVKLPPELDVVVGRGQYGSLSEALLGQPPSVLPLGVGSNYVLIGRITFLKGNVSGVVGSVGAVSFADAGVTNHNDLASIQGGSFGQFYHLNSVQYQDVVDISGMINANPQYGVVSVNGLADVNQQETLSVNTNVFSKTGYLQFVNYSNVTDLSVVQVVGGDTSAIYTSYNVYDGNGTAYYLPQNPLNSTFLVVQGDASGIVGVSWSYQQSAYVGVNVNNLDVEKGVTFTTNQVYQGGLYMPVGFNDSRICIFDNVADRMCWNNDGTAVMYGNLTADNLYNKSEVDLLISSVNLSSIANNGDGTYTWHFSNGLNFTTGNLTGAQGVQGLQGIQGIAGANGVNGTNGINGTNGVNGTSFGVGNGYLYDNGSNVIFFNDSLNNVTVSVVASVYNDSLLISAVNTSANIQSLGFFNSSQDYLNDSLSWYSISNPRDFVNTSFVNANFYNMSYIDALLNAVVFNVSSIHTLTGTLTFGNLSSVLVMGDNVWYNVSELAGSPAFVVEMNFSNVTAFNQVFFNVWYEGSVSHEVDVQLFNFNTSTWDTFGVLPTDTMMSVHTYGVASDGFYMGGGNVSLRLYHVSNGIPTHRLRIDYVALQYGNAFTDTSGFLLASDQRYNDSIVLGNVNSTVNYLNSTKLSASAVNCSIGNYSRFNGAGFECSSDLTSSVELIADVVVLGVGSESWKSPDIKGVGQLVLVNGSNQVVGLGTDFAGGGIYNLDSYFYFYVNGTKYFVFPINNDTSANLTASAFGNQTNWTGGNLTTDFYLMIDVSNNTYSRSVGYQTSATGLYSWASGFQSSALADYAVAVGYQNIANGSNSVAFGSGNVASGISSTAFGLFSDSVGNTAMVWGQNNFASGTYATAFGFNTQATSQSSTAFGEQSLAQGKNCVALGFATNCTAYADVVIGRYNVGGGTFNSWQSSDPVFEVGIGSNATNRSNALTVYKNGSIDAPALDSKYVLNSGFWSNYSAGGTTTSNAVFTPLVGLTDSLRNASVYLVNCHLLQNAGASTTGVVLRVNTTGSPTTVRTVYTKMATTSAMETFEGTNTASNTLSATGSSTVTSIALLNTYIVTGANPSVWTVEFRSEVGGSSATILAGSYCQTTRVG